MATNTMLTISKITREMLRVLENQLAFAKGVNREYEDQFGVSGAKIGDTVNVRKPPRYRGRTGAALAVEDHVETSVPVQLTTQFGVDVSFTSKELLLDLDDFSKRILVPAAATIANKIDYDGLQQFKNVANSVGAPGTPNNTLLTFLQAGAKMDYEACPRDGNRTIVLDPGAQVTIVDALKGLFQSSEKISEQYEKGVMGIAGGFKWKMDQNVGVLTTGPQGGTPLVNTTVANTVPGVAAAEAMSTVTTDGWTAAAASRVVIGDVFTIAGVYAVNPQSRVSTGQLRQFVVTAAASSAADGSMLLSFSPSIKVTGPSQNVDALPANNAAIVVNATLASTIGVENLAYHRDAFTLACADLPLPGGVDMASRVSDKQLGLSIRAIRQYDINTDAWPMRLDVLYGWKTIYQELACRIRG